MLFTTASTGATIGPNAPTRTPLIGVVSKLMIGSRLA